MSGRSANDTGRFVAFTFAAADMVIEATEAGDVCYAAGSFQTRFGKPPEFFIGRPLREMIAPGDHETLAEAMTRLIRTGRLLPMHIRLSDVKASRFTLGGVAIAVPHQPLRLCMTFTRPVSASGGSPRATSSTDFQRSVEQRLRDGSRGNLALVEVAGETWQLPDSIEALDEVLERSSPGAVAHEISPGRFEVLSPRGENIDLLSVVRLLEESLQNRGIEVEVKAQNFALATEGLNAAQVARALRHALGVFARDGTKGLAAAGLNSGLADYIRGSAVRSELLLKAIKGRHFSMLYQPIVSLEDRSIHHYEALIRPGAIADCPFANPQEFVMMAEALGVAGELDLAVANMVCEAALANAARVAFNVSSQSVQSASFRAQFIKLLSESAACAAGLIQVEMTETADIEDLQEANRMTEALRGLRVPFCLDDFGAGSADIRLLKSLSADVIKLDGSYVAGIAEAGRERAFVAGMIEIARAGGAEVVAERVETEAEALLLRNMGVKYGQGWLFGRPGPLPPGKFSKILRNQRFVDTALRAPAP